jgi:ribosomal protein S1
VKKSPEHQTIKINKPYLFQISTAPRKGKVLSCEFVSHVSCNETVKVSNIQGNEELQSNLNFQNLIQPGNLHKVIVAKVLENGLLVKFLGFLYGLIFEDDLEKPLQEYQTSDKFEARIIIANVEEKRIYFSCKSHIINLKPEIQHTEKIGKTFDNGFVLTKKLYGNSYLASIADEESNGDQIFHAQIHKKEIETEFEDTSIAAEGLKFDIQIRIKSINYFESLLTATTKKELLDKKILGWENIEVKIKIKLIDKLNKLF